MVVDDVVGVVLLMCVVFVMGMVWQWTFTVDVAASRCRHQECVVTV